MGKAIAVQKTDEDWDEEENSRDAYNRAYLGLTRLKGLVVSASLLNGDELDGYEHDNIACALGLVEKWIDGTIEDFNDIHPAQDNILTACKRAQRDIATGALGLHGNLHTIKGIFDRVDGFLKVDLVQILKIQEELKETAVEISRQIHKGEGAGVAVDKNCKKAA